MNTIEIQTTIKAQQVAITEAFNERSTIEIMGAKYMPVAMTKSFYSENLNGERGGVMVNATLEIWEFPK